MGLRDRIAKALALPPGATTQTEQQIMATQQPLSGMTATPMPRDPHDYVVPFSSGVPLIPFPINAPRDDGRATPRRYEFPVAWNLQIVEQRLVPFKLLRDVADSADMVRKCVEAVKSQIMGMEWDIVLSPDAVERIQIETEGIGAIKASKIARDQLMPEIIRCKSFWRTPDRVNGLNFSEWIGMAIEEMLVIDALSIYPNMTLDNESLFSLEILDGATIKPLLDERGGRPLPPHPAYQQILWGFPRSEFTASADADGEFTVDDLIYAPRTRRPWTPYGYSAVERALPVIDLYLKRQEWLRTEFTDGVTPDMVITTDSTYGGNPELLKAYERIFNDDLAGKTQQRRRARIFPEGFNPEFSPSMDSKFNSDIDELFVKYLTGHFGIGPTQVGFAPKGGLGGVGVQKGEQQAQEELGLQPTILWLQDLCNQMSYRFLGMSKDLIFSFQQATAEDETAQTTNVLNRYSQGAATLNETRDAFGLPMLSFPEADMPMILNTMVPLADVEELASIQENPEEPAAPEESAFVSEQRENGLDAHPDLTTPNKSVSLSSIELAAFAKWTKGSRRREFVFEFLDSDKGKSLNVLAKHDPEAARELASVFKAGDGAELLKAGDARGRVRGPWMAGGQSAESTVGSVSGQAPRFAWER